MNQTIFSEVTRVSPSSRASPNTLFSIRDPSGLIFFFFFYSNKTWTQTTCMLSKHSSVELHLYMCQVSVFFMLHSLASNLRSFCLGLWVTGIKGVTCHAMFLSAIWHSLWDWPFEFVSLLGSQGWRWLSVNSTLLVCFWCCWVDSGASHMLRVCTTTEQPPPAPSLRVCFS